MTEFEIIDDKLVRVCQHEFTPWYRLYSDSPEKRHCYHCGIEQMLVPRGYGEDKPKKSLWNRLFGE